MNSISTDTAATERTTRDWLVPLGGALGLIVGNGPISVFAFGVFIGPLESEFGWSRASLGIATALCALLSAITLPFVGVLMDKFGVRRPLAIAICLFGLNVAAIGQSATLPVFIALTALAGATGAAQSPIGYVKSIASYFDRRRGLAIGIAMSGIGSARRSFRSTRSGSSGRSAGAWGMWAWVWPSWPLRCLRYFSCCASPSAIERPAQQASRRQAWT